MQIEKFQKAYKICKYEVNLSLRYVMFAKLMGASILKIRKPGTLIASL